MCQHFGTLELKVIAHFPSGCKKCFLNTISMLVNHIGVDTTVLSPHLTQQIGAPLPYSVEMWRSKLSQNLSRTQSLTNSQGHYIFVVPLAQEKWRL